MKKTFSILLTILFIVLAAAGICYSYKVHKETKENEKRIKVEYEQKLKEAEEIKKQKEAEIELQNQEIKKAEEKKKALDEKCNQAQELFNNKKFKDAVQLADEVLAEDNNNYRAYTIKGIALCYDRKSNGFDEIEKALDINPGYSYAMYNMALAYDISFDYDNALKWYEKVLSSGKEDNLKALSNYGIAVIEARKGNKEKATEYLKAAVKLDKKLADMAKQEPLLSDIEIK
ncbi:MAG: hypothetical protein GX206_00655 [Clostridiales bacterium]|nr:hypothetical protein [Clostridiales bacterium]